MISSTYSKALSCEIEQNHSCIRFNLARPTAEVLEWLQQLFQIMDNNANFKGDERTLNKIGRYLSLDKTTLITVAARTPQKSALKLFRLLYPTVGSRANCGSISKIPRRTIRKYLL